MNLNINQALKLTFSLVIFGLLSGCVTGEVLFREVGIGIIGSTLDEPDREPWETGKNHYEPIVLTSNKDMIRIKYLSVGPNAEHEQVKLLMFNHCNGAYIETSRVELRGYDTVEAECTGDTKPLK